jgi:predicted AlkP superfamily pyrophosphatase or phosphodiesterase
VRSLIQNLSLILFALIILVACNKADTKTTYPLILISIDGLHPDYITRAETPTIDMLIKKGALAEHLITIFPSKTFPSHYSIATGLYTENSGVVSNTMYDSIIGTRFTMQDRSAVTDPRWYQGEPIWVTAEKQNVRAGTLFWPGSEASIKGIYATHWLEYNHNLSHDARVDTLINWFQLPIEKQPKFTTFYLSKVDTYGHRYGPNSDSIAVALQEVDRTLGYLIDELKRINVWPNINILLTSDHGMAEVSSERVIIIDEIIDLQDVTVIDWSPVAMIQPKKDKTEIVYEQLKAAENNYRVYKKKDIPEEFHIKNHPRVPEIMIVADMGFTIITRSRLEERGVSGGAHGYNPRLEEMHAFFLATGPSFKEGYKFDGFEAIHIYELMCALLNIEPAANDGSLDTLKHILKEN